MCFGGSKNRTVERSKIPEPQDPNKDYRPAENSYFDKRQKPVYDTTQGDDIGPFGAQLGSTKTS